MDNGNCSGKLKHTGIPVFGLRSLRNLRETMESMSKLRMMLFRRTCPERFERSCFRSFLRKEYLTFDWEAHPIGLQKNCKNSPWIIYTLISPYIVMKAIINRPQIDRKWVQHSFHISVVAPALLTHITQYRFWRPWDAMVCHWTTNLAKSNFWDPPQCPPKSAHVADSTVARSQPWFWRGISYGYKLWHSMTMCLDIP